MIEAIVNKVVGSLEKNEIIQSNDKEIYQYGVEVLINNILLMMGILGVGMMIGTTTYTIIFIIFFPILRKFMGGYHAKKRWQCFVITNLIHVGVVMFVHFSTTEMGEQLLTLFLLLSLCIIFIVDPIENENNPKTEEELEKNKQVARWIVGIMAVISFLGFNYIKKWQGVFFLLAIIMCVGTSMMLPDYIKKGGMTR